MLVRKDSPRGGRSSWNANLWIQEWESILDSDFLEHFKGLNILVQEEKFIYSENNDKHFSLLQFIVEAFFSFLLL